MSDSTVLVALITVLASVVAIVGTVVGVMIWIVKRMDKRQDSTIEKNTEAIEKNTKKTDQTNEAHLELAKSINNSADASRSLEESIKKRDEQDREFQKNVIESFLAQSHLLETIIQKADRNHDAIVDKQTVKIQTVEHQTVVEAKQ